LADVAEKYGHLPPGSDRWPLKTFSGFTMAHPAAECRTLPKDFCRWELANNDGSTVAHASARHSFLPEGFIFGSI
jgi:hypothetical protein